ncbi:MAG TPA: adenylate/guanylate cyclase domain-containing protein [Solirubrobacterales bacterium]|jgi:class 3 adenylate cyclase/YHS domain-containing protein
MGAAGEQTFLFADLAGFTALTEVHGDEQAADLAGEFVDAIRSVLPEYGAEEVKCIGDAVMLRCPDAAEALRLGVRVVGELGTRHGFPSVRVGMNTGPAVERRGDWFGTAVNVAARVSGAAGGGEVLLTEETRLAAGPPRGVHLLPRGRHPFRNLAEPVRLYAAVAEGEGSAEGMPVDPVCRMAVDPDHSAGTLYHGGARFFFCSLACASAFAAEPERYE